jgi:hypothetical protein
MRKRRWVSTGRRMRWKIGPPFDNEIPAKTASGSSAKASQPGDSSRPQIPWEGEGGDAVNEK